MNKLKLLSTSILCSLSTMGFAEDWDGKNDQLKAWNKLINQSNHAKRYV